MVRTSSGYSGGTLDNPSYRFLGDHSETVQVEFDPNRITYVELLDIFWDSHRAEQKSYSRQYRNAIFFLNHEQQAAAEQSLENVAAAIGNEVHTAIEPAGEFYPAEDYHQKYLLRRADVLFREFQAMYPDAETFAASTAAARINGYLGCNGRRQELEEQFGQFGLSPEARAWLAKHLAARCSQFQGVSCPAPP